MSEEQQYVIIIRRGENMRVMYTFERLGLFDTTPFELAQTAVLQLIELQTQFPGRADLPIIPGLSGLGLYLPGALGPLDPEMMLGYQLVGQWKDLQVQEATTDGTHPADTPTTVLNLIETRS